MSERMQGGHKVVTAAMIVIGDEILSGRTKDKNLGFLAEQLTAIGVRLMEGRFIPDMEEVIVATVNDCRARHDYVFTSGGIGPTHDDITADAIAKAFGVGIDHHPDAVRILESHYAREDLNEARLRMARIPFGAELIDNPISKAPGFRLDNVFVMAGVPQIFQAMVGSIRHQLSGGTPLLSRNMTVGLPEGTVAEDLRRLQGKYPDVGFGSYPSFRHQKARLNIVLRSMEPGRLDAAAEDLAEMLKALGGDPLEGA